MMVRPSKQRDGVGEAMGPVNLRSPGRGEGCGAAWSGHCRRGTKQGSGGRGLHQPQHESLV